EHQVSLCEIVDSLAFGSRRLKRNQQSRLCAVKFQTQLLAPRNWRAFHAIQTCFKPSIPMSNPNNSNNHSHQKSPLNDRSVEKEQCARSMIPALNLASMTCSLVQLARIENPL